MIWHLYTHQGYAVLERLDNERDTSGLSALRPPSTRATHSDSGQQPLRDIGHNDANKENDSLQPAVAQENGEREENDTKEDGQWGDHLNKVFNLYSNGGLANSQAWGQGGNAAHHCGVSCGNHDAPGCACGWSGESQLGRKLDLVNTKAVSGQTQGGNSRTSEKSSCSILLIFSFYK